MDMRSPTNSEQLEMPVLLTSAEVAKILRVDRSTLSRWRSEGVGPKVVWLGTSTPRYRRADLLNYLTREAS